MTDLTEMAGAGKSAKDLHKHLVAHGWTLSRQHGGHDVYTHPSTKNNIALPRHKGDLPAPMVIKIMKQSLVESTQKDVISMSVPLFIRCLEWAKESASDDVALHKFTENIVAKNKVLDSEDYMSLIPRGEKKEERDHHMKSFSEFIKENLNPTFPTTEAVRRLKRAGYDASVHSDTHVKVKDPVMVNGKAGAEYKNVLLHHKDVFKFIDDRS